MQVESFIKKVLLDNAIKYDGTCNPNAAMGAVMREFPEYRGKAGEIMPIAVKLAKEINELTVQEQQKALQTLGGADAPEKEERDPFDLDHDNPVVRFEPSPSGALHIGHAFTFGLNHILQERNDGKLILRIADTNPDNIYPAAYELIERDANWYTHENIEGPYIQSDRMELYYSYAEKVLSQGNAYVCTCEPDAFREFVNDKQACPCRDNAPAINLERWELMLTEYEPGDAVVRMKTDITHKNPALRDWPALRINTSKHPRQGDRYRVWPLMNFSVSVDDMEMGVTHTLRAKDHADNAKRQEQFYKMFHHSAPEVFSVGRINFTNLRLSTSETRKLIDEGEFTGWDDIRLPFLPALRRRGFTAEAFLRHAQEQGISATDKTVSAEEYFEQIEAFNREFIDEDADRLFFVANPESIMIQGAPDITVEKDLYPERRPGGRKLHLTSEILVDPEDIKDAEGMLIRLMDAYNIKKDDEWRFVDTDVQTYRNAQKRRIIHYLPAENTMKASIHLPDGTILKGICEKHPDGFSVGQIVQFERFGFVRVDSLDPLVFWYAHR